MMNVIFVGIGIFSIGIIIFALMLLLRGDGSREQKLMQYFFLGALVQNVGYLLELTAPTFGGCHSVCQNTVQYQPCGN